MWLFVIERFCGTLFGCLISSKVKILFSATLRERVSLSEERRIWKPVSPFFVVSRLSSGIGYPVTAIKKRGEFEKKNSSQVRSVNFWRRKSISDIIWWSLLTSIDWSSQSDALELGLPSFLHSFPSYLEQIELKSLLAASILAELTHFPATENVTNDGENSVKRWAFGWFQMIAFWRLCLSCQSFPIFPFCLKVAKEGGGKQQIWNLNTIRKFAVNRSSSSDRWRQQTSSRLPRVETPCEAIWKSFLTAASISQWIHQMPYTKTDLFACLLSHQTLLCDTHSPTKKLLS